MIFVEAVDFRLICRVKVHVSVSVFRFTHTSKSDRYDINYKNICTLVSRTSSVSHPGFYSPKVLLIFGLLSLADPHCPFNTCERPRADTGSVVRNHADFIMIHWLYSTRVLYSAVRKARHQPESAWRREEEEGGGQRGRRSRAAGGSGGRVRRRTVLKSSSPHIWDASMITAGAVYIPVLEVFKMRSEARLFIQVHL